MNGINYHEYSQYTCDRTSCRYHYYIIYDNEIICRDCKIVKGEHNQNCYHTSTPSWCCFQ